MNMHKKRELRAKQKSENNNGEKTNSKTNINWYPGHMVKAQREITEKLKLVDVIYELVDARLPLSSCNPILPQLIKNKPRIVLLNKASIADPIQTKRWIKEFSDQGIKAIAVDAISGINISVLVKETKSVLEKKFIESEKKGFKMTQIRAMIIGIPNVGKSTLINKMASRSVAKTGDRPGVTKQQQWIHVNEEFSLLDTPGIMWPKFESEDVAFKLAVSGAIKDEILPIDEVCIYAMKYFDKYYHDEFVKRYDLSDYDINNIISIYDQIGKKRGCFNGKEIDYEKVSRLVLMDYRSQRIGNITLDYHE